MHADTVGVRCDHEDEVVVDVSVLDDVVTRQAQDEDSGGANPPGIDEAECEMVIRPSGRGGV